MDFARAILNSNSNEAFDNIFNTKESVLDGREDDFLFECLSGFSDEDIAGCLEDFENEYTCIHSANSSMIDLPSSLPTSCASLPGNMVERTVGAVGQSLHNDKDMADPFQYNNKSELDWFPTLHEDPLIFVGTGFEGDPFLTNEDHKSDGVCALGQIVCEGTSHKLFSSAEPSPKKVSSSVSNNLAGFTVENPVPARGRRNRTRSGIRVWSTGTITDCNTATNTVHLSTLPSSSSPFCQSDIKSTADIKGLERVHRTVIDPQVTDNLLCSKKAWKITHWKKSEENGEARRCAHCLTQKTPQWRIGPTGPKTLCNACGVRYKSGRLFPEYRPVRSPTFTSSKHSNSHKKVMEMRSKQSHGFGSV
eukprot:c18238_g1_i2 orf=520-1608(-)